MRTKISAQFTRRDLLFRSALYRTVAQRADNRARSGPATSFLPPSPTVRSHIFAALRSDDAKLLIKPRTSGGSYFLLIISFIFITKILVHTGSLLFSCVSLFAFAAAIRPKHFFPLCSLFRFEQITWWLKINLSRIRRPESEEKLNARTKGELSNHSKHTSHYMKINRREKNFLFNLRFFTSNISRFTSFSSAEFRGTFFLAEICRSIHVAFWQIFIALSLRLPNERRSKWRTDFF